METTLTPEQINNCKKFECGGLSNDKCTVMDFGYIECPNFDLTTKTQS